MGKRRSRGPQAGPSRRVPEARPPADSARPLAIVSSLYLALLVFGAYRPAPGLWGLDPIFFLRPGTRILLLALAALGTALVALELFPSRPIGRSGSSPAVPIVWSLIAATAFWLLRVRTFFLGDQMVWLEDLGAHRFPLFSEPLAAMTWHGYVRVLDAMRVEPGPTALAVLPVACGVAAGFLAWRIAAYLAPKGPALLAFALLVTLGVAQLYAGYIESYGILSLPVLLYLYIGLKLERGEGSPWLLAAALALAVATHLVALCLVPSYVLMVARSRVPWLGRVALIIVPVVVGLAGWAVAMHATNLAYPFHTLTVALESVLRGGQAAPNGTTALRPLLGLANVLLLVTPVPLLLLVAGLLSRHRREGAPRWFLIAAALPGALGVALLSIPGSPAQDWDLLSIAILPTALLGLAVGLERFGALTVRAAAGLTFLSVAPLLGFLLVNADARAGVARFEAILDPATPLSSHERAYGNEKLAKYFIAENQPDSLLVYARRAHEAEPASGRYWIRVGAAYEALGRYGEAIPYLEEGLRRAPDRYDGYYALGNGLVRVGRNAEAVTAFRKVLELAKPRPEYFQNLGVALLRDGKPDSARAVWQEAERRWPDYAPAARSLAIHFGTVGPASGAP